MRRDGSARAGSSRPSATRFRSCTTNTSLRFASATWSVSSSQSAERCAGALGTAPVRSQRADYGAGPMAERIEVDTCVVGAGYAGLTAACRLTQAGTTVAVLEARDRIGGRIWTQPLSDGSPVDRGGAWLGPDHDPTFTRAREVDVSSYKTWVHGAHLLVDHGRIRRYTGL